MVNAGTAATTAPKPTRLATLSTGSTDALAPASMVSRRPGKRRRLTAMTAMIAAASAVTTAHTPPTAESEVAPNLLLGKERNIEARQNDQRHQHIDAYHHEER